jgi:hypothetical protein
VDGQRQETKVIDPRVRRALEPLLRAYRAVSGFMLRASGPHGKRRRFVLLAGIVAIVAWQMSFTRLDTKLDRSYVMGAASGMHNDQMFMYFFWYANLFPVASTLQYIPCDYRCTPKQESQGAGEMSKEAADRVITQQPQTLVMDVSWTWYAGDRGKIFLYWLDTWLKGAPWKPSVKPFHRLSFIAALAALFASFWWIRRPWMGALAVVLLGSNPFQLWEVHGNDNVFGWSITTAILILAIHLPLLVDKRWSPRALLLWPIATGIILGTIRTFRSEPMPIILAVLLTYAQVGIAIDGKARAVWLRRAALVVLFFATFSFTDKTWTRYFNAKNDQARTFLTRVGGHPFPGPMRMYHHFWHPVWCGLGDFDTTKGYKWDDFSALAYAKPILVNQYHEYVPSGSFAAPRTPEEWWDDGGFYKRLPYDIPHYNDIIRDKVVGDIKSDPMWYARIIAKRVERVLTEPTPVRITWNKDWITLPGESLFSGKAFVPLLFLCLFTRARLFAKILVFTLPTCVTAIIVFSGRGIAWYGIFHIFTVTVLGALLIELARRAWAFYLRRRREA